jgi:hypothetical protein
MSTIKPGKAADFLRNMSLPGVETPPPANSEKAEKASDQRVPARPSKSKPVSSRANLKHIGGYFDKETVEKVALLRARLEVDNSELIELAIGELFWKQSAKRAFGDS